MKPMSPTANWCWHASKAIISYLTQQAMLWTFLSRISSLLKRLSTSQPLGKDVTHDIPISLSSVCKRDMISNGEGGKSRRSHAGSFEIPRCQLFFLSSNIWKWEGIKKGGQHAREGWDMVKRGGGKWRRRKSLTLISTFFFFPLRGMERSGLSSSLLFLPTDVKRMGRRFFLSLPFANFLAGS